jgi:DNA processing protein
MQCANTTILLHLSLINGIGPATVLKTLKRLYRAAVPDIPYSCWTDIISDHNRVDLSQLYDYSVTDVQALGISQDLAELMVAGLADRKLLTFEQDLVAKHAIKVITLFDPAYPELLKEIHTPPLVLFVQGDGLTTNAKRFAVVGARKATGYAHRIIDGIVPSMVNQGWQIVSGGALGADAMAHAATIKAGGVTIAVLGSGLLMPYPDANKPLFKAIVESGGAVVSPFPLTMEPERGNFPARNRVIAGLSVGCLVAQAASKSGALITAKYALEQGRHVFAVPGMVDDLLSAGCHELIKQGATLVNSAKDILEDLGEAVVPQQFFMPAQHIKTEAYALVPEPHTDDPVLVSLQAPVTLDELCEKTGLAIHELQNRLFDLQLEGKVRQNFAGTWQRVQEK